MADFDSSIPPETKTCTRCKQVLPITDFPTAKRYKGGISSWCRSCNREYAKEWRCKNIEKERERHRQSRAKDPEKHRAKVRKSYKKHAERRREDRRLYYWRNPEKEREYSIHYWKLNPLKHRELIQRARARKKSVEFAKVDYAAILERDGYVCHICGSEVAHEDVEFDHVEPMAHGGKHIEGNIAVAHSKCNRLKNAKVIASVKPHKPRKVEPT